MRLQKGMVFCISLYRAVKSLEAQFLYLCIYSAFIVVLPEVRVSLEHLFLKKVVHSLFSK